MYFTVRLLSSERTLLHIMYMCRLNRANKNILHMAVFTLAMERYLHIMYLRCDSPSGQALDLRLPLTHKASQILLRFAGTLFGLLLFSSISGRLGQNIFSFYIHTVRTSRK